MIQLFMKGIKQAMENFKETVEFENGRYIVQLPFRKSYNELSDNYSLAKQRFQGLWRRFGHDSELYQQYREIILDYSEQGKNTKRFILQAVGKIFDLLGLISPFTVRMKCLLQDLWKEEIQWDDPLPTHIEKEWKKWREELPHLGSLKIPRTQHTRIQAFYSIFSHINKQNLKDLIP
ncbi:uncharacterized protein NPIL_698211 [Nephila pilipes]|uniref:Uncharacterized protein n=1 Tax=Nephila pilipes TaxID=299642 RepID=A0A8X6NZC8_NEPPI|nr:uncharacterized protein NPIL_698211 [Nephila pilipes]